MKRQKLGYRTKPLRQADGLAVKAQQGPGREAIFLVWFGPRILPISPDVVDYWGRLITQAGRPVPAIDSLLAAMALRHDLQLVTRNTSDFYYVWLEVINP